MAAMPAPIHHRLRDSGLDQPVVADRARGHPLELERRAHGRGGKTFDSREAPTEDFRRHKKRDAINDPGAQRGPGQMRPAFHQHPAPSAPAQLPHQGGQPQTRVVGRNRDHLDP